MRRGIRPTAPRSDRPSRVATGQRAAPIPTPEINSTEVTPGQTYYWWVTIDLTDGSRWIYQARSVTIKRQTAPPAPPPPPGNVGGAPTNFSASTLKTVDRWTGASSSIASSPVLRTSSLAVKRPRQRSPLPAGLIATGPPFWAPPPMTCTRHSASWSPGQPHWLHLSPGVCRGLQTLLSNKPVYANRITANAVDTLTHEMLHALGWSEQVECLSMQTSPFMSFTLGLGFRYGTVSIARGFADKQHPFHPRLRGQGTVPRERRPGLVAGRALSPMAQFRGVAVHRLFILLTAIVLAGIIVSSAFAAVRVTKRPGRVLTGDTASVTVSVSPQARCTIGVYYSTTASHAAGLGPKRGTKITWTWRVGSTRSRGHGR